MRTLLLNIFLVLGLATVAQNHCWIKYEYDAAGNRIKRYWWCGDPTVVDQENNSEPKSPMARDFGLRVFPNPANEHMQLSSAQELTDAVLQIVDLQGHEVYAQRFSGMLVDVDVSKFSAGVYSLRLRTEQEEFSTTFSIMH
jgi:hypothetical protein